ncbi:MAG: outer membrane beta-barrel protein [Bacteroidales bacterium]
MKKIITISVAILFCIPVFAQENQEEEVLKKLEANTDSIAKGDNNMNAESQDQQDEDNMSEQEAKTDTTTIRFGKKKIVIVEKDGSTSVEIPDDEEFKSVDDFTGNDFTFKRKPSFKGHWAGFEWGFNGFMDANQSINMKDDLRYLELKQGRSWNLNLNILQYSLGFGTDKVGLVTGLGFEFNNYHFRNQITLKVDETGITVPDSSYFADPNKNVTKSKLSTTHLTAPLLLEFQIPTQSDRHRIFFSAGVIGGVRIGTSTKVKYEGTSNGKDKVKDDYNLSPFRYGFTARIGYRQLKLFANYYPTPLFEEGKGDEIYPFSLGLILLNF